MLRTIRSGLLCGAMSIFLFPFCARAQITVSDVIVHMQAGKRPIKNIAVRNSADEVLFVTVSATRLLDPSEQNSPEVPADDLLVSPRKFSIPAKGERTVRLVMKKLPEDMEHVYTVSFAPTDRAFDDAATVRKDLEGRNIAIRVLTGMGILLFVDPRHPRSDFSWERQSGKVIFRNTGNQHVRLLFGEGCPVDNQDQKCLPLPGRRIYGGKTIEVPVADELLVKYSFRRGVSGDYEDIKLEPLTAHRIVSSEEPSSNQTSSHAVSSESAGDQQD